MTCETIETQTGTEALSHRADRKRLLGLILRGFGAFAALVALTVAGLSVIYLYANGDIFPSSDCILRVNYFCGVSSWAIIASALAAIVLALWLLLILQVLMSTLDADVFSAAMGHNPPLGDDHDVIA